MSPLTKIFVILLVVCSMLTSAATVVFVNKVEVFDQANKALAAKKDVAERDLRSAQTDAQAARGKLVAAMQQAALEADAAKLTIDKANTDLAAKSADNTQLTNRLAQEQNNGQGQLAQLGIAQQTSNQLSAALNTLRDTYAKAVQQQAETDAALARQRQLADTYGRQVEYLTEQVKKLTAQNTAMAGALNANHIAVPAPGDVVPPVGPAAPQVSGVVREKQNINGVTYLTISVGAADNVVTGMEFSVVDSKSQPPQYLGVLTITQTDSNSSIGRLQADDSMSTKVKQGDEVTTHLQ